MKSAEGTDHKSPWCPRVVTLQINRDQLSWTYDSLNLWCKGVPDIIRNRYRIKEGRYCREPTCRVCTERPRWTMHEGDIGWFLRLQLSRVTSIEARLVVLQLGFYIHECDFSNCTKWRVWMGLPEPCRPNLHPSVHGQQDITSKAPNVQCCPNGTLISTHCIYMWCFSIKLSPCHQ
jgi:hypothetical protein